MTRSQGHCRGKIVKIAVAVILLFSAQASSAFSEQELAAMLDAARVEMDMPGVRAALRYPDGRIVLASVGLADQAKEIPLDNTLVMPGGSTGKTFVATLAMLLVEEGVLSLDDLISRWLADESWFRSLPNAEFIRVRHLLSHSAGLHDYPGSPGFLAKMVWRVIWQGSAYFEPDELIGFTLNKKPLFPAGEGFSYTDIGYLVLGKVIESVSGREYYDLLAERILQPLDLMAITPQNRSVISGMPPGYQNGVSNLREDGRMKLDPRSEWTGGGLVTTPALLVRFLSALAEGGVVSDSSLTAMLQGEWRDPDLPWHYGYGLFVRSGQRIEHGGLWPGYRTHMAHFMQSGVTIAVQTNRDGDLDLQSLVNAIERAAGE